MPNVRLPTFNGKKSMDNLPVLQSDTDILLLKHPFDLSKCSENEFQMLKFKKKKIFYNNSKIFNNKKVLNFLRRRILATLPILTHHQKKVEQF